MRRIIVVIAFIVGISLFSFFFSEHKNPSAALAAGEQSPRVGTLAPDFSLNTLKGKTVSLSHYRGKVVMLNFWASWCPPCRAEMPSIEKLYRRMEKTGDFVLLAVNVESNANESIKAFAEQIPLTFPILLDREHKAARLFQVSGIPQTYIIGPNGVIVKKVVGGRDWNTPKVVATLTSLMKGE